MSRIIRDQDSSKKNQRISTQSQNKDKSHKFKTCVSTVMIEILVCSNPSIMDGMAKIRPHHPIQKGGERREKNNKRGLTNDTISCGY